MSRVPDTGSLAKMDFVQTLVHKVTASFGQVRGCKCRLFEQSGWKLWGLAALGTDQLFLHRLTLAVSIGQV